MTAISSKRARLASAAAIVFAFAPWIARASCTRAEYQQFIHQFITTRDVLQKKPQWSLAELTYLDSRISTCLASEPQSDVRFKLRLFRTGIRAYIGVADAASGNRARGKAETEGAVAYAKQILRENQNDPGNLRLAEQLLAQLRRPAQLIEGMQSPSPKPSG